MHATGVGRDDVGDGHLGCPPEAIRQTEPQPAGSAPRQGRDDHLFELVAMQSVSDGGERIRVADDRALHIEAGELQPPQAGLGSGYSVVLACLHVGGPGEAARNRGDEEPEAGR